MPLARDSTNTPVQALPPLRSHVAQTTGIYGPFDSKAVAIELSSDMAYSFILQKTSSVPLPAAKTCKGLSGYHYTYALNGNTYIYVKIDTPSGSVIITELSI